MVRWIYAGGLLYLAAIMIVNPSGFIQFLRETSGGLNEEINNFVKGRPGYQVRRIGLRQAGPVRTARVRLWGLLVAAFAIVAVTAP